MSSIRADTVHLSEAAVQQLLRAATLAPSGDNIQPWQFEVDRAAGRITVHVDETRDRSPMNAGQRMSRIAVGAAVENLRRTVEFNGGQTDIQFAVDGRSATIRVQGLEQASLAVDPVIAARVTNRRPYDGRPIPEDLVTNSHEADKSAAGVRVIGITEPATIRRIARLVRRADSMLFGLDVMRRAFFENVRFDLPSDAVPDWGLSLGSLEVRPLERPVFRALPRLPDWLFRAARIAHTIGAKSERLVRSSSGLCLIVASDDDAATDLKVGSLVQQIWLTLTRADCAVQPMSSLCVLDNWLRHMAIGTAETNTQSQIEQFLQELAALVPLRASERPAFLLRFGYAESPSGRTGRLKSETLVASPPVK